jgi:hypothetical protein
MVPQPFAVDGNQLYLDFLPITGDPGYLGYNTPIIAPEPSVEQVARVVRSMGDIIVFI